MKNDASIRPFDDCPCLDGYHCITSSLAKIYHHAGVPISEDLLLGLGAGLGFMYWKMSDPSGDSVFIGGRGNLKGFFEDLGSRTGVSIRRIETESSGKAESVLVEKLKAREPVVLFGDMGMLPWFGFPEGYHFGGHSFVVCGYDGRSSVLASDMESGKAGLKKGFYYEISLEQLGRARASAFKPFPPKNARLELDFARFRSPGPSELRAAIAQEAESMLSPPIANFGVPGIRKTAKVLRSWPRLFSEEELRANLFNLYIFIEIGGTGGGCFRYMYSRFLEEASSIAQLPRLREQAARIHASGELLTETALLFKDAATAEALSGRIAQASSILERVASIEEEAFSGLASATV
jgi:hypothetical protein